MNDDRPPTPPARDPESAHDSSVMLAISPGEKSALHPRLSVRLFAPSSVLAFVLLGLTTLPMASCEANNSEIVPFRVAMSFAGFEESVPPTLVERIVGFVASIPLLFLITTPYWTAVPVLLALPLLFASRSAATALWRLLVLALAVGLILLTAYADSDWALAIGAGGLVAAIIWVRSSPRLVRWARRWKRTPAGGNEAESTDGAATREEVVVAPTNPVAGGFVAFAVLSATMMVQLGLMSNLLIGGRLAAMTNLLMAVVAFVSARQAWSDDDRVPQFATRDLLITMALVAFGLSWFWL